MACKISDNYPLSLLAKVLGYDFQCHSLRENCIHRLPKHKGKFSMAARGAVIGFCQALFRKQATPEQQTKFVINQLASIDAPWKLSHELYWGNRTTEAMDRFFEGGFKPLLGKGRVPVVITALDPGINRDEIDGIISTKPLVFPGETVLLRIVLSSLQSVEEVALIMKNILKTAFATKSMPVWWPLLQGNLQVEEWERLKERMGEDWKYINIAVNPFIADNLPKYCWKQVTVAQVVVGHDSGIMENGDVALAPGMKIMGAPDEGAYNIYDYMESLSKLEIAPTIILLGPALDGWDDEQNKKRVLKILPHIKRSCSKLWYSVQDATKEDVWNLSA